MRPVAAWLAISNGSIFNDIVAVDPSVVLDHGEGATWERDKFPNHRTKRPDLMPAHLAACRRQWAERVRTPQWVSLQEKEENAYSLVLQNVRHASPTVAAVFVPRIRQWLSEVAKVNAEPNEKASEQNLRQAVEILRKSGNSGDRDYLAAIATERLWRARRSLRFCLASYSSKVTA